MNMKYTKILVGLVVVCGMILTSCEKMLGPDDQNLSTPARLYREPAFAEGLLMNGYTSWRNNYILDEVATDDAVTNVKTSPYLRMATGEWSAIYNPMATWNNTYQAIWYLNYFLSIVNDVDYAWDDRSSSSDVRDSLFKKRFTAEAKVLRAWHYFEILKNHGGVATNGNPEGFVLIDTIPDRNNVTLPRSSYNDCVQFILRDIQAGIRDLPNVYGDIPGNVAYNMVFGNASNKNRNRIMGRFAKALKSRVSLYAASQPLYTVTAKWDSAAVAAAKLLTVAGGGINALNGLTPNGLNFWRYDADAEILFRLDYSNQNSREIANFPPSRYGGGQTNPSQNLVDAFPMANGYPINHTSSGYVATTPYASRDPRLKAYIVYNGNEINGTVIRTNVEEPKDGLNKDVTSTRTGYYMKKLLQPGIVLNPSATTARHFYTVFRYTEMFLNFAEAANEAWGPTGDPNGYGFTAKKIMELIRKRGNPALGTNGDPYLASITSKEDLRQLIRNERRIELCFEGFRFWDMRRWNLNLTEKVKGMKIENGVYTPIDVEERMYQPYMQYGPIPYQETLKNPMALQNAGW